MTALFDSLVVATAKLAGQGGAERLALHMANRLAARSTDPGATEDEQLANRLAAEEFERRVLPMLLPPP